MINLDWFQPFESSVYSSGVIYGVICNLPREVRFKRENILYLGLLPEPKEVKLHMINHYLSPIVDELQSYFHIVTQLGAHFFWYAYKIILKCDCMEVKFPMLNRSWDRKKA